MVIGSAYPKRRELLLRTYYLLLNPRAKKNSDYFPLEEVNIWLLCMSNPQKNRINDYPQGVGRISSFESNGYKNYSKKQSPPSSWVRGGVGNDLLNEKPYPMPFIDSSRSGVNWSWVPAGSCCFICFPVFSGKESSEVLDRKWLRTSWWFQLIFFSPPLLGEMIQFDWCFSDGLFQAPTRLSYLLFISLTNQKTRQNVLKFRFRNYSNLPRNGWKGLGFIFQWERPEGRS